ncbi:MAG TPA: hypothetical protein ENI51_08640, partial [Candidatus Atribacteria bacterium]|nr:hypothetical protein [Candidatus Atribacteria bacterium]
MKKITITILIILSTLGTLLTPIIESQTPLDSTKLKTQHEITNTNSQHNILSKQLKLLNTYTDKNNKEIEIEMGRHHLNGKVEKTKIKIEKKQLIKIIESLKNASSFEEKIAILKKYNLIPQEEDINQYKKEIEKLNKKIHILPNIPKKIQNLNNHYNPSWDQVVTNFLCSVDVECLVLIGLGINIPLGLSLITSLLNFLLNGSNPILPSVDLVDRLIVMGLGGI